MKINSSYYIKGALDIYGKNSDILYNVKIIYFYEIIIF